MSRAGFLATREAPNLTGLRVGVRRSGTRLQEGRVGRGGGPLKETIGATSNQRRVLLECSSVEVQ